MAQRSQALMLHAFMPQAAQIFFKALGALSVSMYSQGIHCLRLAGDTGSPDYDNRHSPKREQQTPCA
jgi:hypothetical protein